MTYELDQLAAAAAHSAPYRRPLPAHPIASGFLLGLGAAVPLFCVILGAQWAWAVIDESRTEAKAEKTIAVLKAAGEAFKVPGAAGR